MTVHNRRPNWVTIKSIYGTLCNYWRTQLDAIGSHQCRHRPLSTVFKLGSWPRTGDSLCYDNKVVSSWIQALLCFICTIHIKVATYGWKPGTWFHERLVNCFIFFRSRGNLQKWSLRKNKGWTSNACASTKKQWFDFVDVQLRFNQSFPSMKKKNVKIDFKWCLIETIRNQISK